ncbi:hypothetical protein [Paenibacillus thalictri]|uniref:Uncharacterized protein n=1 Tax=Paenibacillus thalictri TaxID=2527873 RepID=A0A4Q9DIM9_9BACL|nr:hypothetical protein [Paenibacillus thalictri]TBL73224.1 hypothetical protein EYB31_26435 [Paenibacillus thalictri]
MMLVQLLAGILIACILWGLFRLTFKLLLWGFAATFLLLLIPGGMLLLGGFGLLLLSLFATLGVLFLCSLLLGPR